MAKEETAQIIELLKRFICGQDRSLKLAQALEVAVGDKYPDDERFDDFIHAIASYRPGGGPFLYNEDEIVRQCQHVLTFLNDESDEPNASRLKPQSG